MCSYFESARRVINTSGDRKQASRLPRIRTTQGVPCSSRGMTLANCESSMREPQRAAHEDEPHRWPFPVIMLSLINLRIHDVAAFSRFDCTSLSLPLSLSLFRANASTPFFSLDNSTSLCVLGAPCPFVSRCCFTPSLQNEMAGQLTMRTRRRGPTVLPPPLSRIRPTGICFAYI